MAPQSLVSRSKSTLGWSCRRGRSRRPDKRACPPRRIRRLSHLVAQEIDSYFRMCGNDGRMAVLEQNQHGVVRCFDHIFLREARSEVSQKGTSFHGENADTRCDIGLSEHLPQKRKPVVAVTLQIIDMTESVHDERKKGYLLISARTLQALQIAAQDIERGFGPWRRSSGQFFHKLEHVPVRIDK